MFPSWVSFLIVLGLILILSKKELSIVLCLGAVLLGILTGVDIFLSLIAVFSNLSIILLAVSVTLIPILGGILEESGMIFELIQKLKISNKVSLILSPSLFGLLPVAGGALMSAPLVDQIDPEMPPQLKVGINVWYRHVLLLIYPLSSLILVASFLSGNSIYSIVLVLIVPFIIMNVVGYLVFLRKVDPGIRDHERDLKIVLRNILPLIIAPIIDVCGRILFPYLVPETFLIIGLCLSIGISLKLSNLSIKKLKPITKKMKVWRFPLLILAMFLFLEIFVRSGIPDEISILNLPFGLFILIGFLLGFATGRVQLPISILIPIYLTQYSLSIMPLYFFMFLYVSTYLGYLITPIHPCLAYNVNYFKISYLKSIRPIATATLTCLALLMIAYYLSFIINAF